MQLLVGGDPEIFLKDTRKNMYVSATDFDIPGTKDKAYPVKCGAVQIDGTALEINIDPADTAEKFSLHLKTVITEAKGLLPKHIAFDFTPAVHYEPKYYAKLPAACKVLGCNLDYQATTGQANLPPKPIGTMRTGAGHIALGWTKDACTQDPVHFHDCRIMSQRLDKYFLTYKSLWDSDLQRFNLYGFGGAFRPKPFGVEYRALSNAWVKYPMLHTWVFDSAKWIFEHALNGGEMRPKYLYGGETLAQMHDLINEIYSSNTFPRFPANFKDEVING